MKSDQQICFIFVIFAINLTKASKKSCGTGSDHCPGTYVLIGFWKSKGGGVEHFSGASKLHPVDEESALTVRLSTSYFMIGIEGFRRMCFLHGLC